MTKIKDIPKVDRPREKFLKKGSEALSKTDLLAILIGSGTKGINAQQLSQKIIKRFGKNFLIITVDDLKKFVGIGDAKAIQIVAAIALVKQFYSDDNLNEIIIKNSQDVFSFTYDLRNKKNEHLVCLYLNARNVLIKKEVVSIGLVDKALFHPREIFYPATELNAASIILVHNHPSGDLNPSKKDTEMVKKIAQAGEIMGISVIDFLIVAEKGYYSFYEKLKNQNVVVDYIADGIQGGLFDLLEIERAPYEISIPKAGNNYLQLQASKEGYFQLQNRRYLGNKYKLLGFIEDIIIEKCASVNSICDIFAGTGVVGKKFNRENIKIISNDFLFSNYVCLQSFLGTTQNLQGNISEKIKYLNNLPNHQDNYFSEHFGGTYFTAKNARKAGTIREEIEKIAQNVDEKNILLCSLIYAMDKVANTVGHYDAFRKKLDMLQPMKLLIPDISYSHNTKNKIFKEDVNVLIRKISCDVLYIDPPYNSRQYSDAYHLLENLAEWKKPEVIGVGRKMNRSHIKSDYCLKNAVFALEDLIRNADCKHILLSYNNTGDSLDGRSNASISDNEILQILNSKGNVEIFEKGNKAFSTGKSKEKKNMERIFYCKVTK